MNWKEYLKGFRFFWKGLKAAGREMWVSFEVLIVLTLVLSTLLYFVEHAAQPEVYTNWWDAFVWSFMGYLGNPGKFATGDPITLLGRFLWIAIAIVKIMIFAVPAGLVASGFNKAMAKDKRDKELAKYREKLRKSFRRISNKPLREYLNTLPNKGGEQLKVLNFVPMNRPVGWLQAQKGMSLQDIADTVNEFPEFRMANKARAMSEDDDPEDRFLVEHFPINRSYGCCINRGSKVTIVATASYDEVGMGWFTYYLAKFGGFNYVSKEVEADIDQPDSFFNISKNTPESANRSEFIKDITDLAAEAKGERPWIILMTWHIKDATNTVDFHFVNNNKNGDKPTVIDTEVYEKLLNAFTAEMTDGLELQTVQSTRYPLLKGNLLYHLKDLKDMNDFNGFVLRPSSKITLFNSRRLEIAFRMAKVIGSVLTSGKGMLDRDLEGFKSGVGYQEQKVDKPKEWEDIYKVES